MKQFLLRTFSHKYVQNFFTGRRESIIPALDTLKEPAEMGVEHL
jgi:hypothetical protein